MEGDHILTVNDRPIHSAVQCQQLLQESLIQNRILDLLIELDVNEAVTPSSGTFSIKLMRSGLPSLGITLNGPVQGERGATWIAKIKKGGIAYRYVHSRYQIVWIELPISTIIYYSVQ